MADYNKLLQVPRGTKARLEQIKLDLLANTIVYATDTKELGIKLSNGNIEYFKNATDIDAIVDTLETSKQDKLVAGDGISISGNIISADGGLTVEVWNTATKTLELSDSNKLFACTNMDNQTLIIPADDAVAFPIGTMITFLLTSNYTVTFVGADSGVDIMSIDSLVELATQYGMASLIKLGSNTWQLVGALE